MIAIIASIALCVLGIIGWLLLPTNEVVHNFRCHIG
jgi:hypothetical protein